MSSNARKTRSALRSLALAALSYGWLRARKRGAAASRSNTTAKPRPAQVGAPPVHFGNASRKRARNTKLRARLGLVGLIAALIGVPGANLGWDLIGNALNEDRAGAASSDLGGVTTSESAAGMLRFRGNLFKHRPTPSPTPTETQETVAVEEEAPAEAAPVAPSGSVTEIIYAAAAEFGIDPGYLAAVASCESGLDPSAVNPAGYHGLFQFDDTTWGAYGYGSIYDPVAQARTAARMLAAGMASRWPNCA